MASTACEYLLVQQSRMSASGPGENCRSNFARSRQRRDMIEYWLERQRVGAPRGHSSWAGGGDADCVSAGVPQRCSVQMGTFVIRPAKAFAGASPVAPDVRPLG